MIGKRILLFCLFLLLSSTLTLAQKKYYITNYNTKNGLPENNLQSLQLDKDGYLWASYSNGLLRFDGHNFRNFITSRIPYTAFLLNKTLDNELLARDVSGTVLEIKNQHISTLRKFQFIWKLNQTPLPLLKRAYLISLVFQI